MAIDLENEVKPIDPGETKYESMLANLQGNILKPHGRSHAVCLFLNFSGAPAPEARKWIAGFTRRYVTSAWRQHYEAREYQMTGMGGRLFANFCLSAAGYRKLGFDDLSVFEEYTSVHEAGEIPKALFQNGMKHEDCRAALNDPRFSEWEEVYRQDADEKVIHAVILLADDDAQRLREVAARIKESLAAPGATVVAEEEGEVLRGEPASDGGEAPVIEHFGYRDGISQPLFYRADVEKEIGGGAKAWNPAAPLKLALVKDPLTDREDCFGSYLVYRKLEQNVKKFNETVEQLAADIELPATEKERAGALLIGRFKNGTPLLLSPTAEPANKVSLNNFNFSVVTDPAAGEFHNRTHSKCPFQAHIRKTNPRGDSSNGTPDTVSEKEMNRRIARRGITYGRRAADLGDAPETGVGLLFLCFQSNIPDQFAFIQARWANEPMFAQRGEGENQKFVGADPLIGRTNGKPDGKEPGWCPNWGDDQGEKSLAIQPSITFKGGEFFFAPSIAFLMNL